MNWFSIAATIIAAMGAFAACVTAYASLRNSRKNTRVLHKQMTTLDEVHVLVNARLTAVLERVDQLTRTLEHANVNVPHDPHS